MSKKDLTAPELVRVPPEHQRNGTCQNFSGSMGAVQLHFRLRQMHFTNDI